jgi:hypothetical protein
MLSILVGNRTMVTQAMATKTKVTPMAMANNRTMEAGEGNLVTWQLGSHPTTRERTQLPISNIKGKITKGNTTRAIMGMDKIMPIVAYVVAPLTGHLMDAL